MDQTTLELCRTALTEQLAQLKQRAMSGEDVGRALADTERALGDVEGQLKGATRVILHLHMTGDRFAHHGVPLELWRDLSILQELLETLTRVVYLRHHPDRKRMPCAFWEKNALMVRDIQPGSATLPIEWNPPPDTQRDMMSEVYVHEGVELLVNVIKAANENRELPADFPRKLLSTFNQFGRHLRDGESVGLSSGESNAEVYYDKQSRRKLLLAREDAQHIEEEWERDCVVVELNSDTHSFKVRELGSENTASLTIGYTDERVFSLIADAHRKNRSTGLHLRTTLLIDPHTKQERFKEITDRAAAEPIDLDPDFRHHLAELRQLKSGWYDEREHLGEIIEDVLIQHVRAVIECAFDTHNIPVPYIYPTIGGGIQAEWDIGDWRVDCEWEAVGTAYIHAADIKHDVSRDASLEGASEEELVETLGEMIYGCKNRDA